MERNRVHGAPWLEDVHALRARKAIDRDGRLLLEGLRLTAAAWSAGLPFERAVYAPEHAGDAGATQVLLARLRSRGVPCERLDARAFSKISYKADGVVAIVRHRAPSLAEVLARDGVIVVLDALSDPGNVGAVVRSAGAWAAGGVVAVDGHAKLFHPKSLRASMGAIFHTPTCAATREELVRSVSGRLVVVLAPDGDALDVGALGAAARSMVVVLGNEKRGVHRDLARVARRRLAIPMRGCVDSLNVSHAAAIVLWEVFRRAA